VSIDILILAAILISTTISILRGFFKEAISLVTWVGAVVIALAFSSRFATLLPKESFESPAARAGISALILFFGTLLVGGVMNWLFQRIMTATPLRISDRIIGAVFGVLRACVIIVFLVLLANLEPSLKQGTWWQQSRLLPYFQMAAGFIHARLPENIGQHFDFTNAST
jgi:membrane protein required for colicin V production